MSAFTPETGWFPKQSELSSKSILLSAGASLVSIALVIFASRYSLSGHDLPFLTVSMGASAVLLFVLPSSSLSQPWAFAGGHLVSALIGISCAQWIPGLMPAAALAVAASIIAMHYLNCMHPPGGAAALLAVAGGDSIHALGYQFLLTPILLNVIIMLVCLFVYRKLSGLHQSRAKSDDHGLDHNWHRSEEDWLVTRLPFSEQDLAHAMAEMDTYLDITLEDLNTIYSHALQQAYSQDLDGIYCRDAMSYPAISVDYDTQLEEVWRLFKQHNIRGLPVVNNFQRVIGIITVNDFISSARQLDGAQATMEKPDKHGLAARLAELRQATPGFESTKPEVAGQIMSSPVITADEGQLIAELMPLFTQHAIHHIPVLDNKRKLSGILTREDVMAAWATVNRKKP